MNHSDMIFAHHDGNRQFRVARREGSSGAARSPPVPDEYPRRCSGNECTDGLASAELAIRAAADSGGQRNRPTAGWARVCGVSEGAVRARSQWKCRSRGSAVVGVRVRLSGWWGSREALIKWPFVAWVDAMVGWKRVVGLLGSFSIVLRPLSGPSCPVLGRLPLCRHPGQGDGTGPHQPVRGGKQHMEVVKVLRDPAVAGLDESKIAFDDQVRVLNLGPHRRLA